MIERDRGGTPLSQTDAADLSYLRAYIWPHLRPAIGLFVTTLLIALGVALLAAAQPLLTRYAIDNGLIARDPQALLTACVAMLGVAAGGLFLGGLYRTLYIRASGLVLFALRSEAFTHLLGVPPRRFSQESVGDLISRLDGDVSEVQRFATDAMTSAIVGVLTLAATVVVMFQLSWELTALVVALLPAQLFVRRWSRPRIESTTREVREQSGRIGAFLVERLSSVRLVQGVGAERREVSKLRELTDFYLAKVLRQQMVAYSTGALAALFGHVSTAVVFLYGGSQVLAGSLSVGTLVAFVAYLSRLSGSATTLLSMYTGYHRARVSLVRVGELLRIPTLKDDRERGRAIHGPGSLTLEHVSVTAGGKTLLDDVSWHIEAASRVYLVGASGVGKSTLADLFRRFLEPDAGQIMLDGFPIREYRLEELRRRIAVIDSSPQFLSGTIEETVRYGNPDASLADIQRAIDVAGLRSFVDDLPDGYQTRLGALGDGLSGGQRQRLAIARALLCDPVVVIFDEATSNIDLPGTLELIKAVDDAFSSTTRIFVSHNDAIWTGPGTVHALDSGRIVQP